MGTIIKKLYSLCFFFLVISSQSSLFPQVIEKDLVTDTIRCRDKTGQSYALYIPAHYDNRSSWPVILIFDPAARGTAGVAAFIKAGKKYGFILACSNNSRNGPMSDNFIAADAMLKDVEERFAIDQKRIFAAGFSGGARFATAYAVKEKKISGIIGCGAGLPNDRMYFPSINSNFLYYGLVGTQDMNYLEMHDLPGFFSSQTGVISYLMVFSGIHEWPGSDLLTNAVEWIVLQMMKSGLIPSDQTFLSNMENKTQNLISSQLSDGDTHDAVRYIRFAIRDFNGTPFSTKMKQLLTDTENSAGYQTAVRKWNKMAATEQESREKYLIYLGNIVSSAEIPDSAIFWWKKETRSLLRLRDKGSTVNSQMASRILNFISILCSEQGTSFFRNGHYLQAAFLFGVCTLSDSENQFNYYNLARSLALSGKAKESLNALSEAVSHGFKSWRTIESEQAFAELRDNSQYKDLINKIKK